MYAYQAKTQAAKVEKRKNKDEDGEDIKMGDEDDAIKRAKTRKRNIAIKSVDPAVLKFVKEMMVPFELVARHGASLEQQMKRAVRVLWRREILQAKSQSSSS